MTISYEKGDRHKFTHFVRSSIQVGPTIYLSLYDNYMLSLQIRDLIPLVMDCGVPVPSFIESNL